MFHREQKTGFRVSEFSLSGAFLHSLLKPRFVDFNVGELFEYLADSLWNTVGVMTDRVDFTLVNVCSPFNRFSHGILPEPPSVTWPTGKALIFTFAIRRARPYDQFRIKRNWVHHNSNQITKWGLNFQSRDYVSISVDMSKADEWHLKSMRMLELQYLFNIIGMMTKSFVRRQNVYQRIGQTYDDQHEVRSLRDWYVEIYSMPIKRLVQTVPYHLWPFNYHVWEYAPNILSPRTITPAVATYYFMYLHGAIRQDIEGRIGTLERLGVNGETGIGGYLVDSILRLVQDARTPGDRQLSTLELLAPAVIETFLRTGSTQLEDTSFGAYLSRVELRTRLIADLQSRENDLGAMFLPAKNTMFKLLTEDTNWRDTIRREMEFPQVDISTITN